jgi:hypothetical protein
MPNAVKELVLLGMLLAGRQIVSGIDWCKNLQFVVLVGGAWGDCGHETLRRAKSSLRALSLQWKRLCNR